MLRFQSQPRFRKWIRLEEQKNKILKAVEESSDQFPDELFAFLSTALRLPVRYFEQADWEKIVRAFYITITTFSYQTKLALFEPAPQTKEEEVAWNYDGRAWHLYAHMLAQAYGWSLEYIANLKLDDALPTIQEILLDEQFEKEFQWTMSERSSYYDDKTKTAKANPLSRPNWMNRHIDPKKELKTTQIPVDMLPMGTGLNVNDILASQKT